MWRFHLAYFVVPALIGAAAIAVFLTRRSLASSAIWLIGLPLVALLVAGVSWTLYAGFQGQVAIEDLLKAFATLYCSLFVVLISAAFACRRRIQSRAVGIGLLIVLFVLIGVAATLASTHFFGLVNAEA